MCSGIPLLAINQRKAAIKLSVDKSLTISKCIAFIAIQTHIHMYFNPYAIAVFFSLIKKGPQKNTRISKRFRELTEDFSFYIRLFQH